MECEKYHEISMFFEPALGSIKSTLILLVSFKQKNSLTCFSLRKCETFDANSRDWKDFLLLQRHLLNKAQLQTPCSACFTRFSMKTFLGHSCIRVLWILVILVAHIYPMHPATWGKSDDHPQSLRNLAISAYVWLAYLRSGDAKICQASLPSLESQPLHPKKQPSLLCWRTPPFQHTSQKAGASPISENR